MRASQAFKEEENTTIYFLGIKDNLNYYSFKIFPQNISPKYFSEDVIHDSTLLDLLNSSYPTQPHSLIIYC